MTNYARGVRLEYQVMNHYRKQNMLCLRSAGSHSPIDCVAIPLSGEKVKLIQCKKFKTVPKTRAGVAKLLSRTLDDASFDGYELVEDSAHAEFEVFVKIGKQVYVIKNGVATGVKLER